jgi:L-threonylcarbamoyladenylate synthase
VLPSGAGIRVPLLERFSSVRVPVLQTSANLSGGADARCIEDVPESIRSSVDLVVDGGELPGIPSTVLDLSVYEADGTWTVLREGAVPADEIDL